MKDDNEFYTPSLLLKAGLGTTALLAILGVAMYALWLGITLARPIHIVQSFGALLFSGIGLSVMLRFWLGYFRRGNRRN